MATPPDVASPPQHRTDPSAAPQDDQLQIRPDAVGMTMDGVGTSLDAVGVSSDGVGMSSDGVGMSSDGEVIAPGGVLPGRGNSSFAVRLDNFEGPFDLLLGLIAKHRLDVTEIALSQVTDDFMAHIRALGDTWDLGEVSEFLLVAATLLDLKAARLLPVAEVEDDEDLALLEARDLLFARLLQYRAFKDVAATFAARIAAESRYRARDVPLEPQFMQALPDLVLHLTPLQFAELAARAVTPKVPPTVALEHLHAPQVSVREQAALIMDRMRRGQTMTFRALVSDAVDQTLVVVARFLALLELFREGAVGFDQVAPLGELTVRWTGAELGEYRVDEFEGAPDEPAPPASGEPDDEVGSESGSGLASESASDLGSVPGSELASESGSDQVSESGSVPGSDQVSELESESVGSGSGTDEPADKAE